MNYSDRCLKGELARKCDEKRLEIDLDDTGRIVKFRQYCRAKDFKKVRR